MISQSKILVRSFLTTSYAARQNFLGAWWLPLLVERSPARFRKRVALRVLSFSPHYFFSDGKAELWMQRSRVVKEADRNFRSRARLAEDVIRPHVAPTDTVIDYGCGPGYMAMHISRFARRVIACDISEGTLACARVLNGAANIDYINVRHLGRLDHRQSCADLIYSFATAQHLRDAALQEILRTMYGLLRPGGILLMHVVLNGNGWKEESDWARDASTRGRLRLRYGLNCFSRASEQVLGFARTAGFAECQLLPMASLTRERDLAGQHLLLCRAEGRRYSSLEIKNQQHADKGV
jgi:SAM-dependent methyltransferase